MTPKDKLGREIVVGDFIVYGHALGRSAGLRIGKVLDVTHKPGRYPSDSPWRIRVQGVDDDWARAGVDRPLELCRPGTLQFPERTVVDRRSLPLAYAALFTSVAR